MTTTDDGLLFIYLFSFVFICVSLVLQVIPSIKMLTSPVTIAEKLDACVAVTLYSEAVLNMQKYLSYPIQSNEGARALFFFSECTAESTFARATLYGFFHYYNQTVQRRKTEMCGYFSVCVRVELFNLIKGRLIFLLALVMLIAIVIAAARCKCIFMFLIV